MSQDSLRKKNPHTVLGQQSALRSAGRSEYRTVGESCPPSAHSRLLSVHSLPRQLQAAREGQHRSHRTSQRFYHRGARILATVFRSESPIPSPYTFLDSRDKPWRSTSSWDAKPTQKNAKSEITCSPRLNHPLIEVSSILGASVWARTFNPSSKPLKACYIFVCAHLRSD